MRPSSWSSWKQPCSTGLPGIGRLAHRLEDILEYAMEAVGRSEAVNPAMARDSLRAVLALQQMTAYLQGEEAAPQDTKSVLQRMLDWVGWIRAGQALTASPAPLDGAVGLAVETRNQDTAPESAAHQAVQTPLTANADAATLRVDFHDQTGAPIKSLLADDISVLDAGKGKLQPMRLTMRNLRSGGVSTLAFSQFRINAAVSDAELAPQALQS